MQYIVFDLEATCWEGDDPRREQMEITEIGAVKLNDKLEVVDTFQSFVKPRVNPILSNFCKGLTGIKQEDIDVAPSFPAVWPKFAQWACPEISDRVNTWFCSWGFYDKKQVGKDLLLHRMNRRYEWMMERHISIKHQHGALNGKDRGFGMDKALEMEGFSLDGSHHRALDDAKNIAKIFAKIFSKLEFK